VTSPAAVPGDVGISDEVIDTVPDDSVVPGSAPCLTYVLDDTRSVKYTSPSLQTSQTDWKQNVSLSSQASSRKDTEYGAGQQQSVVNVIHNTQPSPNGKGDGGGDPREYIYPAGFRRPWFSELFGCFDDMAICKKTY